MPTHHTTKQIPGVFERAFVPAYLRFVFARRRVWDTTNETNSADRIDFEKVVDVILSEDTFGHLSATDS